MSNFKIIDDLPSFDLLTELNNLIKNNIIFWSKDNQICLNTTESQPDNFLLGSGSLEYDWDNAKEIVDEYGNSSLYVPKYEVKYKEEDFSVLCTQFRGTLFEEVYNELSKRYSLGRVRLMKSKSKTCLSWHIDSSPRIHYPIKTHEGCFMVIDNEVMHIPNNTWWWTNTMVPHTAFNGSKEDRLHLVASVLSEK
jgi:hypothetical protein